MTELTKAELAKNLAILKKLADRKLYRRFEFFVPYPKQSEFILTGATYRERLFMAGNQLGKTYLGAFECAMHLTGLYPDWWKGRRWSKAVRAWAAGESSLLVRDVQQKLLCGEPGVDTAHGTGMIPKDCFVDKPSMARGVTDAYDTIQVKHHTDGVPDGISILRFKSYEQGRKKFQGETVDFIWGDEEPPEDVYGEMLTRITATKGMVYITFTPLLGMSAVVARYMNEPSPDRTYVVMTIDDALHFTPEERAKVIAGYPAHERDARSKGIPLFGSGLVFPIIESSIIEPRIKEVPEHWYKLWSIDFGIGHPFGATLLLWDKDADCIHVHRALRMVDEGQGSLPIHHAKAMKMIAAAVPVAWPQDGTAREKSTGLPISKLYKAEGLLMCAEHATWPDGGNSTEAGILEMHDRMTSGRFKVAADLSEWLEERRMYHRLDGQIVKERDDLMSATRIGVMAKRFAKQVPLGSQAPGSKKNRSYTPDGGGEGSDFGA